MFHIATAPHSNSLKHQHGCQRAYLPEDDDIQVQLTALPDQVGHLAGPPPAPAPVSSRGSAAGLVREDPGPALSAHRVARATTEEEICTRRGGADDLMEKEELVRHVYCRTCVL